MRSKRQYFVLLFFALSFWLHGGTAWADPTVRVVLPSADNIFEFESQRDAGYEENRAAIEQAYRQLRPTLEQHIPELTAFYQHYIEQATIAGIDQHDSYEIRISANPFIGQQTYTNTNLIIIPLGEFLHYVSVAGLLSGTYHEIAHLNPRQLAQASGNAVVAAIIRSIENSRGVHNVGQMREEGRADLGATERLILVGLHPQAQIDKFQDFENLYRQTRTYLRTAQSAEETFSCDHPQSGMRAQMISTYTTQLFLGRARISTGSDTVAVQSNELQDRPLPEFMREGSSLHAAINTYVRGIETLWTDQRRARPVRYSSDERLRLTDLSRYHELSSTNMGLAAKLVEEAHQDRRVLNADEIAFVRFQIREYLTKAVRDGLTRDDMSLSDRYEALVSNLRWLDESRLSAILLEWSGGQQPAVGSVQWLETQKTLNAARMRGYALITNDYRGFLRSFTSLDPLLNTIRQGHRSSYTMVNATIADYIFATPGMIRNQADLERVLIEPALWFPSFSHNMYEGYREFDFNIVQYFRSASDSGPFAERFNFLPGPMLSIHRHAVQQWRQFNPNPTLQQKFDFWRVLTQKGFSPESDRLFVEVWREYSRTLQGSALDTFITEAYRLAITDRRVMDPHLRAEVFKAGFLNRINYNELAGLSATLRPTRLTQLSRQIADAFPDAPMVRGELLESFSKNAARTAAEFEAILGHVNQGRHFMGEDIGLRAMNSIFANLTAINHTPTADRFADPRWQMVFYLRGDRDNAPEEMRSWSHLVPEEYVKHSFDNLPIEAKVAAISTLLSTTPGVSASGVEAAVYEDVVRLLLQGKPQSEIDLATQIVKALIAGLRHANARFMEDKLLAFMLSKYSEAQAGSIGELLRYVLEYFGTFGVKIGQLLLASDILGDHGAALLGIEDNASPPSQQEIWNTLRARLGDRLNGYTYMGLIGSASIKFVVLVRDPQGRLRVWKVNRDSTSSIGFQLRVGEGAIAYLRDNQGSGFAVLESILESSSRGLRREVIARRETEVSQAMTPYYEGLQMHGVRFVVPDEHEIAPGVIEAEYAQGKKVSELSAEEMIRFMPHMLMAESRDWRQAQVDTLFDSDRHFGNWIIDVQNGVIYVIDLGQATTMNATQFQQIVELFAASQVLGAIGADGGIISRVSTRLGLNASEQAAFARELDTIVPMTGVNELYKYLGVLTALKRVRGDLIPDSFFSFPISLVHLERFVERLRSMNATLPAGHQIITFTNQVRAIADSYIAMITWTSRFNTALQAIAAQMFPDYFGTGNSFNDGGQVRRSVSWSNLRRFSEIWTLGTEVSPNDPRLARYAGDLILPRYQRIIQRTRISPGFVNAEGGRIIYAFENQGSDILGLVIETPDGIKVVERRPDEGWFFENRTLMSRAEFAEQIASQCPANFRQPNAVGQ